MRYANLEAVPFTTIFLKHRDTLKATKIALSFNRWEWSCLMYSRLLYHWSELIIQSIFHKNFQERTCYTRVTNQTRAIIHNYADGKLFCHFIIEILSANFIKNNYIQIRCLCLMKSNIFLRQSPRNTWSHHRDTIIFSSAMQRDTIIIIDNYKRQCNVRCRHNIVLIKSTIRLSVCPARYIVIYAVLLARRY